MNLNMIGGDVMIEERYKQISGFEDYFITESGRIYSQRPRGGRKTRKLREMKPKNPGKDSKYLNVVLCRDGEQVTKSVHRLVAEAFVDGYFDGAVVNHIDGNNRNNHYTNLEWTTQKNNVHNSYETSGMNQLRNYMWWVLIDPENHVIGRFAGHYELERYVRDNLPGVSATMLTKHCHNHGYRVEKENK